MKLTAKVNGVHQEIELTKEDVYVVECSNKEQTTKATNSSIRQIDKTHIPLGWRYWKYVFFNPNATTALIGNSMEDFEPIPPNTPIISFQDWGRLMESDKEEPKPTKWRFKTQKEFDDTCEKDSDGDYKCGKSSFVRNMFYLFGKEYSGSPDNLIGVDCWTITPEMLMPLEEEKAPTQKWKKLTRGGHEYHIYEEFGNFIWGRIKHLDTWQFALWIKDGKYNSSGESAFDLIPLNRESILKEIEEHENKIKELKAKL